MIARFGGGSGLVAFIGCAGLAVACGAPVAPAPSAANAAVGSAGAATSAGSASAPPAAAKKPGARIAGIAVSKESAMDKRVRIVFDNPTATPCQVRGYTLRWGKAAKTMRDVGLTIPPGESRDRNLKVHPDDGDLEALTESGASIEIDAACE